MNCARLLVTALTLLSLGCHASQPAGGKASPASLEYPYRVVSTCGMVTDIVRAVAGDKAEVVGLMGEGVDPHLYMPTRGDVQQLLDADVVFYSGLMLEGQMTDTFTKVARQGRPVFAVTESIDPNKLIQPAGGHWDPHVWMDVQLWKSATQFVANSLSEVDPSNAEYYQANAAPYVEQLDKLDAYAREAIASIPQEQRVLVTAHDAFEYFARAYDIEVRSVQGISTESQAGVNDINRLVDFIVERKIKAIFVESSVSPKNIRAVIEGAKSKGWTVTVGGELFSDAMGQPGTYEGTYVGMIDHNATVIARALGGTAPERGMQDKLSAESAAKP